MRVLGLDPARDAARLKPRVGVMLQAGGIPPAVPAGEYLRTLSRFHVKPHDTAWLLDIVGLTAHAKTPYKRLSGGQQQRLSLAAAVLGRPELVFLDEPTAGMDPQARHATWDLVTALKARRGRRDPHHALHGGGGAARRPRGHHRPRPRGRRRLPRRAHRVRRAARFRAEPDLDIDSLLAALPAGSAAKESPAGRYLIEVPGGTVQPALLAAVTAWCADRGVLPSSLQIESRTLEDVFLELTGRDLRG